jgi:hypothetical protein
LKRFSRLRAQNDMNRTTAAKPSLRQKAALLQRFNARRSSRSALRPQSARAALRDALAPMPRAKKEQPARGDAGCSGA